MNGNDALILFLLLAGAAMALMIAVALSTRGPALEQAQVTKIGYALRRWWFLFLAASVVLVFIATLPRFPYVASAAPARPRMHVAVTAQQFSFTLPASLPVNTPIIFDVTSRDVNHGFGIYAPDGRLVAQVQAMPDYINHLPVTFTQTGHYTIRCLEYCGIAHAQMAAAFEVR